MSKAKVIKHKHKPFAIYVIIGNVLFMLWIIYNGIDEGFVATPMQFISYIVLITLLLLNSWLIFSAKK